MYDFDFTEIESDDSGKRNRYGYGYVSDRKGYDRAASLSRDVNVSRVGKATRRAGKKADKRSALRNAWNEVR